MINKFLDILLKHTTEIHINELSNVYEFKTNEHKILTFSISKYTHNKFCVFCNLEDYEFTLHTFYVPSKLEDFLISLKTTI